MSLPPQHYPAAAPQPSPEDDTRPPFLRWAMWVAIFALILAAIVCVVWVLIGPDNGIIGRAFLTILLLAGFAGVAILDASLAPRRPAWFVLTSMVVWVVILLVGAFLIWMPTQDLYYGLDGFGRFASFLGVVFVLQLAVLHARLYVKALQRHDTGFTRAIGFTTLALVAVLALMLVLPLTLHEFVDFEDLYWRFVVAVTILAAVGTALLPLINALFAPRRPRAAGSAPPPWPTFADGMTPLPVLPDGSPDWNAYYTGYPTYPAAQPAVAPPAQPAAAPHPSAPYGQPPYPAEAGQPPHAAQQPAPQYPEPGYGQQQYPPQYHPGAQQYPPQQYPPQPVPPQQYPPQQPAPSQAPGGYEGYPPVPPPPR
jgi:hypothetical protein